MPLFARKLGLLLVAASLSLLGPHVLRGRPFSGDALYHESALVFENVAAVGVWEVAHEPSAVPFGEHISIQVNTNEFGCDFLGDVATETTIAVDPNDLRRMVIGWRQFDSDASGFREAGVAYSHDGGRTWVNDGPVRNDLFGSDPVLAVDSAGVFYYSSIDFDELRLYRSFDGGRTWPAETVAFEGFFDKPWMEIDESSLRDPPTVVICNGLGCVFSADGGDSFEFVSSPEYKQFPHLHTGPGGEVRVVGVIGLAEPFIPDTDFTLSRITRANDSKARSIEPIGGADLRGHLGALQQGGGTGLVGTVWSGYSESLNETYVLASALERRSTSGEPDYDVRFVRSVDGGETWSDALTIGADSTDPPTWQWFGTMSVAASGVLDVVWNDRGPKAACPPLCVALYACRSEDGGRSWSQEQRVTQEFEYVSDPTSKLGDYYHMHSDNLGANLAYAGTFKGAPDIYFLRIGPWDCNGNEVDDAADISGGASLDVNGNDVPDECEFRGDADGDDLTTLLDLADMQACFTGDGGTFAGGIATTVDADGLTPSGGDPLSEGILYTDPACALFDLEPDGDVDLADAERILAVMQGPGFSCR